MARAMGLGGSVIALPWYCHGASTGFHGTAKYVFMARITASATATGADMQRQCNGSP